MRTYNLCEGWHALRIAVGITTLAILLLAGCAGMEKLTVEECGVNPKSVSEEAQT
jgi:hypothetical protein